MASPRKKQKQEGVTTEAPYEPCIVVTDTPHCISAPPSVEELASEAQEEMLRLYPRVSVSEHDVLRGILCELIMARLGGRNG